MCRFFKFISLFCWFASLSEGNAQNIGQQTLEYTDSSRNRPVRIEVWYPTPTAPDKSDQNLHTPFIRSVTVRNGLPVNKALPLIIMSHGTGGGRLTMEWLAVGLVKAGYIVAAVDHWGNTYDNKIPEQFLKFHERPLDLSFAANALLTHPDFAPCIVPQKVGAIGFSLGGYSVLALAGAHLNFNQLMKFTKTPEGQQEVSIPEFPRLKELLADNKFMAEIATSYDTLAPAQDRKFKAVFAMAPALGQGFKSKAQFKEINVPVYIVGAEGDKMAPTITNAFHYHQLIANSKFYLFEGNVGHYVFLNEAYEPMKSDAAVFFSDHETVDRNQVHRKTIDLAIAFFGESLSN